MGLRAVLLAGGEGTRLKPFTTVIPKPIVPIGGMAIMEIVVRQLVASGCDHITVAVNHQAHLIMAFFGDGSRWGTHIDYSIEDRPLSTIGPLKLIEDLPENFLVLNGDVLTDLSFRQLYKRHLSNKAIATIGVSQRRVHSGFGVLRYDDQDLRITSFQEKPVVEHSVSMGVYAFSRQILDLIPDGRPFGIDDLLLSLIEQDRYAWAFPHSGYWMDIGRPEDYDQANEDFDRMRDRLLPS